MSTAQGIAKYFLCCPFIWWRWTQHMLCFLHSVLQDSGHWVYCGQGVGRTVAGYHCRDNRGLWGQLPGAFHLTLHPGDLLHPHLPHLHLWNLCQASEGKPSFIHFSYFLHPDETGAIKCFWLCNIFSWPGDSFSFSSHPSDLSGPSTDSELRSREFIFRKSLASKNGRGTLVWQCHRQHIGRCQHHKSPLPQHSPALHVPHVRLLLYRFLPATVQEWHVSSWKGELVCGLNSLFVFIKCFIHT